MIFAQANSDETETTLIVIVLEEDNLRRMAQADPITLECGEAGGLLQPIRYPNRVRMLIAHEPDVGPIYQMMKERRDAELLEYLMRGYTFSTLDGVRTRVPQEGA
jgi:hypothetical protein